MICHSCRHRATKPTEGKGHFLLYGGRKTKKIFGIQSDWLSGKWQGSSADKTREGISDMPTKCGDYAK